jgi:hypothetical protein
MPATRMRDDPVIGGAARRGSDTAPKWADGLTPDQVIDEGQARRLPLDTDPDSIEDLDVRERFLARLQREEEGSPSGAGRPTKKRATPRRATSGPSARASRPQGGRRSSPFGRPTLTPPRGLSVSDGSGFMLGLVLYAIGLNYLRYGWPGVTQWFAAKFVNRDDLTPEQLLQFSEGPSPKLSRNLVRRAEKHPTFGKGSIFAPGTLGRLPTHVDHGGGG